MIKVYIILAASLAFALAMVLPDYSAHSKNIYKESAYQRLWCAKAGGVIEYVLPDRTRVDCLTAEYAVEVDFARKWAEAIGQALYYASVTGKRPAVLLIMESPSDVRYLKRLRRVAVTTKFKIMTITPAQLREDQAESPVN
jgi:hypothetical protein